MVFTLSILEANMTAYCNEYKLEALNLLGLSNLKN